jgi:UDP-N-acetylglucosamine 2-epimerase
MFTVLSILGTRPEAIKMAPIITELRKHPDEVRSVVCSAGQHRQMLDQVLDLFHVVPDVELSVMQADQTLSQLTANLFLALDPVIADVRPDWILAQGDTTTVFVAAMEAHYHRVRFGHVEAGLRTRNKHHPFPEEMNRRIADVLADVYFAPTAVAARALLDEGCPEEDIYITGNTVIDALYAVVDRPYDWQAGPLSGVSPERPIVLITAHRRESFGGPFRELCLAIRELAVEFSRVQFVYPVHLNPNVREPVRAILSEQPNVALLDPLDYLSLVHLMKQSTVVLTDSGGIQEEAPGLNVPVLVMRDTTERPEGFETGLVRLVGTNRERIVREARDLLRRAAVRAPGHRVASPYGDGRAAQRIVGHLLERSRSRPNREELPFGSPARV